MASKKPLKKWKKPIEIPPLDPKAMGLRIRSVRKSYGWRLEDLARVSGVRRMTIAMYECGARPPVRDNLARLALALKRSMLWVLTGHRARHGKLIK